MGLCSRRPIREPLLTKRHRQLRLQWAWNIETGPWMSGRELPGRMNPDFSFIMSMVVSGYAVYQANSCSPLVQQVNTQAGGGGIMLWGTFSWADLGPVVVVEQTMKAANYLIIIADQLHPYMAFSFPIGNGIFQQDSAPCHKARIVLEWFEERTDEFHLMSWPPNSPDFDPMEHI
ncbi:Transposable element Tcb1 transposase [Araneus ventricosus]|uniref:Transposable element Tcb1 transposase n=1 Tax=Araneus ventricosus TaxID=182803 RepID=A0A4Y2P3M3_ARAVE|nr:Transposable element Tcb1 transposase [Araneus ventricosus]